MAYINADIIPVPPKPVQWVGSTRTDVRSFPKEARDRIGHELYRVQVGLLPEDWKPMRAIGAGVCEIRVHTGAEHRLIYVARYEEAIYALHAFEKRSRKTPLRDIEVARRRLARIIGQRQGSKP